MLDKLAFLYHDTLSASPSGGINIGTAVGVIVGGTALFILVLYLIKREADKLTKEQKKK